MGPLLGHGGRGEVCAGVSFGSSLAPGRSWWRRRHADYEYVGGSGRRPDPGQWRWSSRRFPYGYLVTT